MKLLVDCINFTGYTIDQPLNESTGRSRFIVEGILQRADAKNHNGRIYSKEILMRETENYEKTKIAESRALGELDHPDSSVINLKNVSHNILNVSWKGNDIIGKVEILNTPSGNILKELFKAGVTLGISSRGLGSVESLDESTVEVQDDFQLICWDFVSDPSTQGAFMKPVKEGKLLESINITQNNKYSNIHTLVRDIVCEMSNVCCV